jgi:putative transposase
VLEDLKIVTMTKSAAGTADERGVNVAAKRGLNRVILDAGWGQLASFIAYKAADAGRTIEFVNPAYTSLTCSGCRMRDPTGRTSRDVWHCPHCGLELHADVNAARNILYRAGSARMPQAA